MVLNLSEKLKEPNFHRQFFTHKLRPLMSVATPQAVGLQGPLRRVVFVGLYEFIAIVVSSLIFMAVGQRGGLLRGDGRGGLHHRDLLEHHFQLAV